ncbi:hypothetical protein SAMD00019534_046430 [Acytostelium subglobosum LB1]|uniref:hypothetical protein n=1 Tax=Acytostelium subglobosum LB1 TaxID=1410327 RepID=UPI000644B858|nr:hypothetical protein SAMD00019534_046430 [Acytostelium subglobosum LB1]GAM21468.1 hypothetical protein SAMD00019534_046430 [Acytostelium subglobosum LB1]|eukprot:XP_012755587.1 hypothetical protein SAMD00019534_046430 [Acytostelium subglobosum LB1]
MSYKNTFIQSEASITRQLEIDIDQKEEKTKASAIKTVGFDTSKSGQTTPIPIPSATSPPYSKSPSSVGSSKGSLEKMNHHKKRYALS